MDLRTAAAVRTRDLVLTELDRESDGFPIIGLLDQKNWDDPVTENPKAGSTEIWNLIMTPEMRIPSTSIWCSSRF